MPAAPSPFEHAVIAEVESRGVTRERGCKSAATLISQLLRITPNEAGPVASYSGPRRDLVLNREAPVHFAT